MPRAIPARMLSGGISADDYRLYRDIYSSYREFLPKEDLVVFLTASLDTIVKRIGNRDRNFEREIDMEYLKLLYELDREWFDKCDNGLEINTDGLDLVNNREDIDAVVKELRRRLSP